MHLLLCCCCHPCRFCSFDDAQLAEFARLRQQQHANPTGYLAERAAANQPAGTLPAAPALPNTSRQHSSSTTAGAASAKSTWEEEAIDLDDYEEVSPAPKKASRHTPAEPLQPQPLQPQLQPPQPQPQQPNQIYTSNHQAASLPQGLNITINIPSAAPAANTNPYGVNPNFHYPPSYSAYTPAGYSGSFPPAGYGGGGVPPAAHPPASYAPAWPPAGWPPSGLGPPGWPPPGWAPGYPTDHMPVGAQGPPYNQPAQHPGFQGQQAVQPALQHPGFQGQQAAPTAAGRLRLRRTALIDEDDD